MNIAQVSQKLLPWYQEHRRILPWRESPTPYHVWISEIMLQQTRVEAAKEYYLRFIRSLPDVFALADVSEQKLMKLWQGLGYYSRVRNLQKAARAVVEEFDGLLPGSKAELMTLPGIGPYTAGAIASIAFHQPVIAPDGNAYRIFSRLLREEGFVEEGKTRKRLEEAMKQALDVEHPGAFNQALMDLGATICLPNGKPLCERCPLQALCPSAFREDATSFPRKKPKKARTREQFTVLLLECGGKYLLQKRTKKGLLAELWGFPMEEGHWSEEQIQEKYQAWTSDECIPLEVENLPPARHIFSHIEWEMIGYRVSLPHSCAIPEGKDMHERGQWATPDEIVDSYPIPSAYRAYLSLLR